MYEREDLFHRGGELTYQNIAHHDGTGVDKRVPGNSFVVFQLNQRVERCTRGFQVHPLPDIAFHTRVGEHE